MRLRVRATERTDLPQCLRLLQTDPQFLAAEVAGGDVLRLWKRLIDMNGAISALVERDSPQSSEIVGFGMTVFVEDGLFRTWQDDPPPSVLRAIIDSIDAGKTPVVAGDAIGLFNNEDRGLNLLGLHSTLRFNIALSADARGAEAADIREALLGALNHEHRGYCLKTFSKQVFGTAERELYVLFGMKEWSSKPSLARSSPARSEPYLFGITRHDALAPDRQTFFARQLFSSYERPRMNLSAANRECLLYALRGLTDHQIAEIFGVGPDAIRQRYTRVFKIVQECARSVSGLPHLSGNREMKRNKLLLYLRDHPEELRPH